MKRLMVALLLGAAVWLPPAADLWRATAQDSDVQVVVERPLPGTSTAAQVQISGWAVDPSGSGTGIDAVHVYMDGEPGQARARFLGAASYGLNRPDVARALGDDRFTRSGFSLLADLPPGNHSLFVYAHSSSAGPQDGWTRAAVGQFEASSIAPAATVVQPGPAPAGDDGRYRTSPATWQGGNTCARYNGSGTCEVNVPYSIATGATCIQWNQRGQCMSYLPADGATGGSSAAAPAPTRAPGASGTAPLAVPTAAAARPPAVVRAAAPPAPADDAASDDTSASDDGSAPASDSAPTHPPVALPAARPPGIAGAQPAAPPPSAGGTAPGGVRAAAPALSSAPAPRPDAPASIIQGNTASPLDPGTDDAAGSRAAPTVITLAPSDGPPDLGSRPEGLVADYVAPTAAPVAPQVVATQQALQRSGGGSGAAGVSPLRSGCALYIGCGPPTPVPSYPSGSTLLSGGGATLPAGSAGATTPAGGTVATIPAGGTGATVPAGGTGATVPAGGTSAAIPSSFAPALVPTPTPTACPPLVACVPPAR